MGHEIFHEMYDVIPRAFHFSFVDNLVTRMNLELSLDVKFIISIMLNLEEFLKLAARAKFRVMLYSLMSVSIMLLYRSKIIAKSCFRFINSR